MQIPKPNYKAQDRKRKAAKKRKDAQFQSRGVKHNPFNQEVEYVRCGGCGLLKTRQQMSRHHIKKRRHLDTRWEDSNAIDLCYWDCHVTIERIGNKQFAIERKNTLSEDEYNKLFDS